jgi:3-Ketosteroid 9alpha-hydroxylase C-terminal domain
LVREGPGADVTGVSVREQCDCVFVWHQPNGTAPRWELPDLFHKFGQFDTDAAAYYRPYPECSRRAESEPVHPQIVAEKGPDSAHFRYVHGASVTPVCLNREAADEEWRFYVPPERGREQVENQFLRTVWEDLDIWRDQEYVEHPALSKVDAKPYMAMRKWATQFYEVPA